MIEIKLPTSAAVSLLTEQMEREFETRQASGLIEKSLSILDISFDDLKQLAETSAFDLIMLLPIDLLIEESNLPQIIAKTVRALANIYDKPDFNYYSDADAQKLLRVIKRKVAIADSEEQYIRN